MQWDSTPLHAATEQGDCNADVIETLVAAGCDPDARDVVRLIFRFYTSFEAFVSLLTACEFSHSVYFLPSSGGFLHFTDRRLHKLIETCVFLCRGGNTHLQDGKTPRTYATEKGKLSEFEAAVKKGLDKRSTS